MEFVVNSTFAEEVMGQGYEIGCFDRKEYMHPHCFGEGYKLLEFGSDGNGIMQGLSLLLACSNGRGGGDFPTEHPLAEVLIGRWAGRRVAIVGDYSEAGDIPDMAENPHQLMHGDENGNGAWADISLHVLSLMRSVEWINKEFEAESRKFLLGCDKSQVSYYDKDTDSFLPVPDWYRRACELMECKVNWNERLVSPKSRKLHRLCTNKNLQDAFASAAMLKAGDLELRKLLSLSEVPA